MNNKGFAITTVIYSMVLLLSSVMLLIVFVLNTSYETQKKYNTDIAESLNECLEDGTC